MPPTCYANGLQAYYRRRIAAHVGHAAVTFRKPSRAWDVGRLLISLQRCTIIMLPTHVVRRYSDEALRCISIGLESVQ